MDLNAIFNNPQNLIRKSTALSKCIAILEDMKAKYPDVFEEDPMVTDLLLHLQGLDDELIAAMNPEDYIAPPMPAADAMKDFLLGRITGSEYMKRLEELGRDLPLHPSHHGEECIGSGKYADKGIEIQCDECPHFLICFPDWKEAMSGDASSLS